MSTTKDGTQKGFEAPNYTMVPNDFFDLMMPQMDMAELKVLICLMRATFGFHRPTVQLSIRQIARATGLTPKSVMSGAEKLCARGVVGRTVLPSNTTVWECVLSSNTPLRDLVLQGVIPAKGKVGVKEISKETKETNTRGECAEDAEVQEQIAAGRKTMDGLLASMQAPPGVPHYPHRDKFPEQYRPWADLYVELTGSKPLKCDFSDWMETFQEWIDRGLSAQNLRDAWARSKEKDHGFLVAKPRSLTNTAVAIKAKEHASADQPRSVLEKIRMELGGQSA